MINRFRLTCLPLVALVGFCPVGQLSGRDDPTLAKERESVKVLNTGFFMYLAGDDKYLATIHPERHDILKLWEVKGMKELACLKHEDNVRRKALFAPDGKTLATICSDISIKLWEVPSLKPKGKFGDKNFFAHSLAFSVDGKMLAAGGSVEGKKGSDELIKVWDVESEKELVCLTIPKQPDFYYVSSVVFSPDGKTIITGGHDSMLRFWELSTGKEIGSAKVGDYALSALVITKDGKQVAVGGRDGVSLWDVAGRKRVHDLIFEGVWFTKCWFDTDSLAFSPDGKVLAVSGGSKLILFDTEVGKVKKWLRGHEKGTGHVAITSDGKTIISAGEIDGLIKFWDMPE